MVECALGDDDGDKLGGIDGLIEVTYEGSIEVVVDHACIIV